MAFDFTNLATRQVKSRSSISFSVGARLVTILSSAGEDEIGILDQQAAVDPLEIEARRRLGGPLTALEKAHVLLGAHRLGRPRGDGGGDDHLDKLPIDDGLGRFGIELAVEGDDAAEGRFGIGAEGPLVSFQKRAAQRHAAGVGVLDDDAGRVLRRTA